MRKEKKITIEDEGRDKGKVFVITEMPASKAEKWAAKALLALSRNGVELPEDVQSAGMAGIAVLGLQALVKLSFEEIEPLMDEMFACVQIKPGPNEFKRPLLQAEDITDGSEEDVQEITTRLRLRKEVFDLHVGFSRTGARLI